jgi:hypothetical protein
MPQLRDITGNWFSDPNLVIATNQLKGVTHVNKFGHNACIAACTIEDVWDLGGTYVYPTAPRIHDLSSTSACDNPCGIGARTVEIHGLDVNFNIVREQLTLNGTCNVPTVNEYLRINIMFNLTVGSNDFNAGQIDLVAQTDGTTSAAILAGQPGGNQTHMAIYTGPAGTGTYIGQVYAGIGRKQAASFTFDLLVRDASIPNRPFRTAFTMDGNSTGSSHVSHNPHPYINLPEKCDIKIEASASVAGADIVAGFDIILM